MPAFSVLGLADDLTGALEIGARFSSGGVPSLVAADDRAATARERTPPGALVIDTETRHRTASEAANAVRRTLANTLHPDLRLIYKKTDSTLRGNIGAELGALREAFPDIPLVYVPAYPAMGRTVQNATLLVDGVPVHKTAFAEDALNPVTESYIPAVLAAQHNGPVHLTRPGKLQSIEEPGIYVCDAAGDDEVENIAAALAERRGTILAAGPAVFAAALLATIRLPRTPLPPFPALRHGLIVNGSRHPRSAAQLAHAKQILREGWRILDTDDLRETGAARAQRTGERVRSILDDTPLDALIVFGGDTAFGILQALGLPLIRPLGEILPGVPLSNIIYQGRNLCLITKAGGFGPLEILIEIQNRIARSSTQ